MNIKTTVLLIFVCSYGCFACSDSQYTKAQVGIASEDTQWEDTSSPAQEDIRPQDTRSPNEDTQAPEDTNCEDCDVEGDVPDVQEMASCTLIEGNTCQGRRALATHDVTPSANLLLWVLPVQGVDSNPISLAHQGDAIFVAGKTTQQAAFASTRADCTATPDNQRGELTLARYRTDGALLWTTFVSGNGRHEIEDIAVWDDGAMVVTGSFGARASFDCGGASATLASEGEQDVFLARYNPDGTLAWSTSAGGGNLDWGEAVATLSDGAVLLTGRFVGEATFGKGEASETTLTALDPPSEVCCPTDMFLARYSRTGALDWVVHVGGEGGDTARDIVSMPDGGAVVVGSFEGSLRFPNNNPTSFEATNQLDGFIVRFGNDGAILWAKQLQASSGASLAEVLALPDGSVVISGSSSGSVTLGQGEPNQTTVSEGGFLARVASDGALQWARSIVPATAITLDADAVIHAGSTMRGPTIFGDNGDPSDTVTMSPLGEMSPAVARFSIDGAFIGASRISGANSRLHTLESDQTQPNTLLITSTFKEETTFFSGVIETTLTSTAQTSGLLMRYKRSYSPADDLCSEANPQGLCTGDHRCQEGQCQPRVCPNTAPTCGLIHSTSSLEDVQITFDEQPCVYTLAEAEEGIAFKYNITVGQDLPDIIPLPQDYGSCGGDNVGGFDLFGVISGNEQRYCLCDTGLCISDEETALTVSPQAGVYSATFPWNGRNWTGPSDVGNPQGEPFLPGDYTLTVKAVGRIPCDLRTEPYTITATFGFTLIDGP